jgi:hypothetical protein
MFNSPNSQPIFAAGNPTELRSSDLWLIVSEELFRVAPAAPSENRTQKSSPLAPAGNAISFGVEALEMALFGSAAG